LNEDQRFFQSISSKVELLQSEGIKGSCHWDLMMRRLPSRGVVAVVET
jgi:hypothetical protein